MAKKIVLTCGESLVAQHLREALEKEPFSLEVWTAMETSTMQGLSAAVASMDADLLINTLVYSVGEDLERRAQLAMSCEHMAKLCQEKGIPLIQLSSHEVFGGENLTVYREDDVPSPLTAYGQVVWDAERTVQLHCEHHIIYRMSWLICSHGDSVFTRLLDLLAKEGEVRVSSARRASPTFIDDACRVLVAMVKQIFSGSDNWGVYHYACSDPCDEQEFAQYLKDIMVSLAYPVGHLVEDDSDTQYPSAVLGCLSCRDDFGVQQRSWRQGIEVRVKSWLDSRGKAPH